MIIEDTLLAMYLFHEQLAVPTEMVCVLANLCYKK